MKGTLVLALVLCLSACTSSKGPSSTMPSQLRGSAVNVLVTEVPADGIELLKLDGHDGNVRVIPGSSIRIHSEVSARAKGGRKHAEAAKLELETRDGTLHVGLSGDGDHENVVAMWTLTVPEHLAVAAQMNGADINVSGIKGGVDINLGSGNVTVDAPTGTIDIRVAVGNVVAKSMTDSHGDIRVRADVGTTDLHIDGYHVEYPDPAGPASWVALTGEGRDAIKISVQVGDASLKIR